VELLLLHPTLAAQSMTTIPVNEDYKARFEALRLREEQLNMKQNIIVRREASVEQSHAEIAKRICQLDGQCSNKIICTGFSHLVSNLCNNINLSIL
jgi:hypothetical protein